LVLKEPVNCGGRNRKIGVAVGYAEDKGGEGYRLDVSDEIRDLKKYFMMF